MARRRFKVSRGMLVIWFMLAGFIFLFSPARITGKFQSAFNSFFQVPLSASRSLSLSVSQDQYTGEMVSRKAYDQLANHLANCEQELAEAYDRMEKLYGIYNTHVWPGREFIFAGVYKLEMAGKQNKIVIDRGKNQGISAGQYVLADNCIVGVVSKVYSNNATVKLVTDSSFIGQVQIGDIRGVMEGCGNGISRVAKVPRKLKVNKGDDVFICKQAGALGAAMKVGTVEQCGIGDNPLLWDIRVRPACDFSRIEDIAVIVMGTEK